MNVFTLEYHTETCIPHSNKMHVQIPEVGNTCVFMVITHTRCQILESLVSRDKNKPQISHLKIPDFHTV